jgi:hypothetical protein
MDEPEDGDDDRKKRQPRKWSSRDRDDLWKLGHMMQGFLQAPVFIENLGAFKSLVLTPLMQPTGPSLGSIQVLEQVMASVMFRHR